MNRVFRPLRDDLRPIRSHPATPVESFIFCWLVNSSVGWSSARSSGDGRLSYQIETGDRGLLSRNLGKVVFRVIGNVEHYVCVFVMCSWLY